MCEKRPSIEFIRSLKHKDIVGAEVGVQSGDNAEYMLNALDMKKLYLVDVWDKYVVNQEILDTSDLYEDVRKRFAGKNVEIIRDTSTMAAKKVKEWDLDFVYIDGNHMYDYVWHDLRHWWVKIRRGGVLCGHDFSPQWMGVLGAVWEFAKEMGLQVQFKDIDWWIVKP